MPQHGCCAGHQPTCCGPATWAACWSASPFWPDRPVLNAVGVHWLALGNILWCINLAGGGEFIFTSQLTHLGGLLIGLWYAHLAGFPRGSWLKALSGLTALHMLSGFVTPAKENINLAFRVFAGWEKIFPHFQVYRLFLLAASAALFYTLERALRRSSS